MRTDAMVSPWPAAASFKYQSRSVFDGHRQGLDHHDGNCALSSFDTISRFSIAEQNVSICFLISRVVEEVALMK